MEENMPEILQLLYELSEEETGDVSGNTRLLCRRIRRTDEERKAADSKHRLALEEILAKKQRISDSD